MAHNEESAKIIREEFGIASQISDRNVEFKFNDEEINHPNITDYHCNEKSVKFAIIDLDTDDVLVTMDFFEPTNTRAFGSEGVFKLELIYIHDLDLRGQGIGSYYIDKLKGFMKRNGGSTIKVVADSNADVFKSDKSEKLSKEELVEYYKKFEDDDIKIEIINE